MEITENVNKKRLESKLIKYTCKLKRLSFPFNQITAADLESAAAVAGLAEALRVVYECQMILGDIDLPMEELQLLAYTLQALYYKKLLESSVTDEALLERTFCHPAGGGGEKVKDSGGGGGGGGFPMNAALQTVGGAFAKVFVEKAIAGLELSSTSAAAPWVKPAGNGAAACGCLFIMAGMALQEKQRGLSKITVKLGAVAMAFAVLLPMTVSLPPVMAWIFGVIAASIVLITALGF